MAAADDKAPQALALHDARSFFERALVHGAAHGILGI